MGYQVYLGGMSKALVEIKRAYLTKKAEEVVEKAKSKCKSKTVAASITYQFYDRGVRIGSPLDLALWLEKGTGVHGPQHSPIVPVSSTVLVFPSKQARGGYVFAKSVQGQPAQPFLEPALRETDF